MENIKDELPVVLSVDDLSKILKVGRNTAYELVRSGKIRSVRVGHQLRISAKALEEFLEAR